MAKEIRDQTHDHISRLRENSVSGLGVRESEHSRETYEPTENFHRVFSRIIGERRAVHPESDPYKRNGKKNEFEEEAWKSEGAQNDEKTPCNTEKNVHPSGQRGMREHDDVEGSIDRVQHVSVFEKLSGAKNEQKS